MTRVLLLTGSGTDAARIRASLVEHHQSAFDFEHLTTLEAGLAYLAGCSADTRAVDLVIADLILPDASGLQVFARVYAQAPELPIVVLVDQENELLALKAVQHGAQDYIIKDQVHGGLVARAAQHAVQYRATEEALARERERLAVTLRSIGEGVIATDTEGQVTLINRIAEELTGWTQEEGAGAPLETVFQMVDENDHGRREDPVARILSSGLPTEFGAAILIDRAGHQRLVETSGAPLRDREGDISGIVLAFRDITARRQLQEERLRADKLESIGKLAGGIAHDFNNLLVGILGNLSLAREGDTSAAEQQELLSAAETATLRARDLARQLLTFASGGAPLKATTTLQSLLADTARLALSGSNVRAELALPRELWPAEVDEIQFTQALAHLIRNARQAMPDGGTIRIRGENLDTREGAETAVDLEPGSYIRITIEDDGTGIAPDALTRIFDPYFTTKEGASGLGLAIAYSIITRHDGRITAHSRAGQGSTFQLYLPAAVEAVASSRGTTTGANGDAAGSAFIGQESAGDTAGDAANDPEPARPAALPRVLLMDDDQMVRQVAGRMLQWLGYDVVTAEDGAAAIARYREAQGTGAPFQLVIMDLTVPGGMGGGEAIRQLREFAPDVRAIVSSGYFNDPIMANYRDYGFDGVIAKPYQLENMRAALELVLGA